jgi:hypothetical protein
MGRILEEFGIKLWVIFMFKTVQPYTIASFGKSPYTIASFGKSTLQREILESTWEYMRKDMCGTTLHVCSMDGAIKGVNVKSVSTISFL